jgi:uroporphyrinogen-III synthase
MRTDVERLLEGRSILVTRPAERAQELARRLEALGAHVEARPTIKLEPPRNRGPVRAALQRLGELDWLVFTSPSGVEFFVAALRHEQRPFVRPHAGIAAIGAGTSRALARHDLTVDLVAEESRGEGLASALLGRIDPGQRVLLVRPERAREVLPAALRAAGVEVEVVAFYQNVAAPGIDRIARDIVTDRFDVLVFTSPSTLLRLLEITPADLIPALRRAKTVAIGAVTADALRDAGVAVSGVATTPSVVGIVDAVCALFRP